MTWINAERADAGVSLAAVGWKIEGIGTTIEDGVYQSAMKARLTATRSAAVAAVDFWSVEMTKTASAFDGAAPPD